MTSQNKGGGFFRRLLKFQSMLEVKKVGQLAFLIGLLQIVGYYLASALVNGSGPWSIPQPDTLLYCQAARRIVDGHAFSFSAGTAVSTGTTSVLYPFFLAVPYWIGFRGTSLYVAGFFMNAGFYLVFLLSWASVFRAWLTPRTAAYAIGLLALFNQPVYCALAQSDTGLWMAVSGLLAFAILRKRWLLSAFLVVLGPWVRPEGALVAIAFVVWGIFRREKRFGALGLLGLGSAVSVALFNLYLTNAGGFSSVSNKGFFMMLPFPAAMDAFCESLVLMVREVFLGHASGFPRSLYAVPILGAVALVLGLVSFDWRKSFTFSPAVFCIAAAGGVVIVAQSGWAGSNFDRYLCWWMPLLVLFQAVGLMKCSQFVDDGVVRKCFLALPVLVFAGAAGEAMVIFHASSKDNDTALRFARHIESVIPKGASLATGGWCGLAYELSERRLVNLSSIYSPEFSSRNSKNVFEILKNEKSARFDYWLRDGDSASDFESTLGESLLIGSNGFVLRKADWSAFDAAGTVPAVPGKRLLDKVDVGYEKDETRAKYEIRMKYAMTQYEPVVTTGTCGTNRLIEVGRMVSGYDEMTVGGLVPGKDLHVVLRTTGKVQVSRIKVSGLMESADYEFNEQISMRTAVDGVETGKTCAKIAREGFSDVQLVIPGKAITGASHRIAFLGDHMAYGYWFYQ